MVSKDKHEYSIKTVGSMDKSQTISQEVQRDSSRADLNKLSQYEIFMLLKTSPLNTKLTKFVKICENVQSRNFSDCFLKLKSMQFCSLNKISKLQKEMESNMQLKLHELEQEKLKENYEMKHTIDQLENRNNTYKTNMYKTAVKNFDKTIYRLNQTKKLNFMNLLKSIFQECKMRDLKLACAIRPASTVNKKSESSTLQNDLSLVDNAKTIKRSTFDRGELIHKILEDKNMNNNISMQSVKHKASFIKQNRQKLIFESPSSKGHTENSDSNKSSSRELNPKQLSKAFSTTSALSPEMLKSPCSMRVLSNFTNYDQGK